MSVRGRKPQAENVTPLRGDDLPEDVARRHQETAKRIARELRPRTLSKEARKVWDREAPTVTHPTVATLKSQHVAAFALYCESMAEFLRLRSDVEEHGRTYSTGKGRNGDQQRTRPEVQQLQVAWKQCVDLLKEFGRTPIAARHVVGEGQGDLFDPDDADFS